MTARNILLRAGSIVTTDVMKASGDITLQSDRGTKMALALMTAGKDISVLAGVSVESWQSELKGQNITLVSRGGDVTSHTSEWPNFSILTGYAGWEAWRLHVIYQSRQVAIFCSGIRVFLS
ncbi:Uncharacterised protein [Klebsiella michiganensis]|nr:Uncharacterised protein [Klebsiella michiganensis]